MTTDDNSSEAFAPKKATRKELERLKFLKPYAGTITSLKTSNGFYNVICDDDHMIETNVSRDRLVKTNSSRETFDLEEGGYQWQLVYEGKDVSYACERLGNYLYVVLFCFSVFVMT